MLIDLALVYIEKLSFAVILYDCINSYVSKKINSKS